jgi:ABC-type multidrug transport system permease subunit
LRTNLNYQQLWNISLYASVVPTLVSALIGLVGGLNGIGVIAYWGLGLFYVASALRAGTNAIAPEPPVEPPIEPPAARCSG